MAPEIAQPEKLLISWLKEKFEFNLVSRVGVEVPKRFPTPFVRVTGYSAIVDDTHYSTVRATVQIDVIVGRDRVLGAEVAHKLATYITRDLPGYRCEYGDVVSARVQYGPIWRDEFNPSDSGMYILDCVLLVRQYPDPLPD